ncbi:MAG: Rrf2 family transcriptional regulator [Vicinamibacteria bacterium]|nr:Rrf2 family transcriptional regulator [Vicinamibacteria bacterium]
MKLSRSTQAALAATLEMAATEDEQVSVSRVAARNGIPETALAKVVQQLVRAGIAEGTRGVGGGYRLTRPPSQISLLEVIQVFEPPETRTLRDVRGAWALGRLSPLLAELDEMVRSTFESITLETLARGPRLRAHAQPARTRTASRP